MSRLDARAFAILAASDFLGQTYVWGGDDDTEGGFDCSGLVSKVLTLTAKHWPLLYDGQRRTAAELYAFCERSRFPTIRDVAGLLPGCLVFYRHPGARIHHVSMHVGLVPADGGHVPRCIEAGGAGSNAGTYRGALRASGSVRYSDSDYHGQGVEWVAADPFLAVAS